MDAGALYAIFDRYSHTELYAFLESVDGYNGYLTETVVNYMQHRAVIEANGNRVFTIRNHFTDADSFWVQEFGDGSPPQLSCPLVKYIRDQSWFGVENL